MKKKGQLGFAFLLVFFIVMLFAFATIEPFKEVLDNARGGSQLNCPGTPDFNQTDYDLQDKDKQLTRRPSCFVTGISMIWFIFAVMLAGVTWTVKNWIRVSQGK